jgi:hypothetical protein
MVLRWVAALKEYPMTYTYTTQRQLRAAFRRNVWQHVAPHDKPAIREAFCNWIDGLQKAGQISDALADRATL